MSGRQVGVNFEARIKSKGKEETWRLHQQPGQPALAKPVATDAIQTQTSDTDAVIRGKVAQFNKDTEKWTIEGIDGEHTFSPVNEQESVNIGGKNYAAKWDAATNTFKLDNDLVVCYSEFHQQWREMPQYNYLRNRRHSIPVRYDSKNHCLKVASLEHYQINPSKTPTSLENADGYISQPSSEKYIKIDNNYYQVEGEAPDTVIVDLDKMYPRLPVERKGNDWKIPDLSTYAYGTKKTWQGFRVNNEYLLEGRGRASLSFHPSSTVVKGRLLAGQDWYAVGKQAYYPLESTNGQWFVKDSSFFMDYRQETDSWQVSVVSFDVFNSLPESLKKTVSGPLRPVNGYVGLYRADNDDLWVWSGNLKGTPKYILVSKNRTQEVVLILPAQDSPKLDA